MVGRARSITGPYLDRDGKSMAMGGGTELLRGNTKWVGPGGESVLQSSSEDLLVFHAYDAHTGKPALQISTIVWDDNWPKVALTKPGHDRDHFWIVKLIRVCATNLMS